MSGLFVFEMIGTIAFAFSGAMVAIKKNMDIFGVAVLGMTTAVGGGIIRDIILNEAPPAAFRSPVYALTAIAVSIIVFSSGVRHYINSREKIADFVVFIMDSVGLGVFTVVGAEKAFIMMNDYNIFLAVFVGMVTGVGGGVLSDLFAGDEPHIFIKHFYAMASIIGALLMAVMWPSFGSGTSMVAGAAITVVLRLFAAHYHWSLPKPKK